MFKSIGTFTILCGLCLGAAQTASAHEGAYDRHESPHFARRDSHRHRDYD